MRILRERLERADRVPNIFRVLSGSRSFRFVGWLLDGEPGR